MTAGQTGKEGRKSGSVPGRAGVAARCCGCARTCVCTTTPPWSLQPGMQRRAEGVSRCCSCTRRVKMGMMKRQVWSKQSTKGNRFGGGTGLSGLVERLSNSFLVARIFSCIMFATVCRHGDIYSGTQRYYYRCVTHTAAFHDSFALLRSVSKLPCRKTYCNQTCTTDIAESLI